MTTSQFTTSQLRSLTVEDLRRHLGQRHSRRLAHNTRVEADDDGSIGVRFHATRVLTFHSDSTFTISTGGYNTVTTKQLLNALLPPGYRVFAKDFSWYLSTPQGEFPFVSGDRWGEPVPVEDCGAWADHDDDNSELPACREAVPCMACAEGVDNLVGWAVDDGNHAAANAVLLSL